MVLSLIILNQKRSNYLFYWNISFWLDLQNYCLRESTKLLSERMKIRFWIKWRQKEGWQLGKCTAFIVLILLLKIMSLFRYVFAYRSRTLYYWIKKLRNTMEEYVSHNNFKEKPSSIYHTGKLFFELFY